MHGRVSSSSAPDRRIAPALHPDSAVGQGSLRKLPYDGLTERQGRDVNAPHATRGRSAAAPKAKRAPHSFDTSMEGEGDGTRLKLACNRIHGLALPFRGPGPSCWSMC